MELKRGEGGAIAVVSAPAYDDSLALWHEEANISIQVGREPN